MVSSETQDGRSTPLFRLAGGLGHDSIDLLFPPVCTFCAQDLGERRHSVQLCHRCLDRFVDYTTTFCRRCGMPRPDGPNSNTECGHCEKVRLHFDQVVMLGVYRDLLREAVIRMKKRFHEPLTVAMGKLVASRVFEQNQENLPQLIVPMPIHWTRRISRGMNVSELLASTMRRKLSLPYAPKLLRCRKKTRKQGTLSPRERIRNVRHAFVATSTYHISGVHVLLVDDVMTTGATANEAAKTCRRAGASRVTVAIVARGAGA